MTNLFVNRVLWAALAMLLSFAVLRLTMEAADLIALLNGLLAGALVALGVAYWPLVRAAVLNEGPYDRGRQYGLGSFITSVSIGVGLATSVYIYTADHYSIAYTSVALARWLAFWGCVLKITSPDFGAGLLYGMGRKVMWLSIVGGVCVAVAVMLVQEA